MVKLNYTEIGQRIRARRKQLSMTQKDLAQAVNLSEGSVSRYENGKVEDATAKKLHEFAEVLGVETMATNKKILENAETSTLQGFLIFVIFLLF